MPSSWKDLFFPEIHALAGGYADASNRPSLRMTPPPTSTADEGRAPLLQVSGVTLQYKTEQHLVTATYRVSFEVFRADRFVVLGPSGCGKSTLLKAIGGYMTPTEGNMRLKGVPVRGPGPDRMFVFQEFDQLLPWKTVKQNVMFALQSSGKMRGPAAEAQAMRYIEKVNLVKFAHSYPHTLSGGMKQRVAIARAMAMEPDVLLMDEPFAALDALTRHKMQEELLQLWEDTRFTVLFVTHSIPEAVLIGNRILLMSPHPGQVKGELNSDGRDPVDLATGRKLSDRIHDVLFADRIEEQEALHHG
jgi:NitT/TauT family transport system ATP-binding protein